MSDRHGTCGKGRAVASHGVGAGHQAGARRAPPGGGRGAHRVRRAGIPREAPEQNPLFLPPPGSSPRTSVPGRLSLRTPLSGKWSWGALTPRAPRCAIGHEPCFKSKVFPQTEVAIPHFLPPCQAAPGTDSSHSPVWPWGPAQSSGISPMPTNSYDVCDSGLPTMSDSAAGYRRRPGHGPAGTGLTEAGGSAVPGHTCGVDTPSSSSEGMEPDKINLVAATRPRSIPCVTSSVRGK